jgi:hypothetical protein
MTFNESPPYDAQMEDHFFHYYLLSFYWMVSSTTLTGIGDLHVRTSLETGLFFIGIVFVGERGRGIRKNEAGRVKTDWFLVCESDGFVHSYHHTHAHIRAGTMATPLMFGMLIGACTLLTLSAGSNRAAFREKELRVRHFLQQRSKGFFFLFFFSWRLYLFVLPSFFPVRQLKLLFFNLAWIFLF